MSYERHEISEERKLWYRNKHIEDKKKKKLKEEAMERAKIRFMEQQKQQRELLDEKTRKVFSLTREERDGIENDLNKIFEDVESAHNIGMRRINRAISDRAEFIGEYYKLPKAEEIIGGDDISTIEKNEEPISEEELEENMDLLSGVAQKLGRVFSKGEPQTEDEAIIDTARTARNKIRTEERNKRLAVLRPGFGSLMQPEVQAGEDTIDILGMDTAKQNLYGDIDAAFVQGVALESAREQIKSVGTEYMKTINDVLDSVRNTGTISNKEVSEIVSAYSGLYFWDRSKFEAATDILKGLGEMAVKGEKGQNLTIPFLLDSSDKTIKQWLNGNTDLVDLNTRWQNINGGELVQAENLVPRDAVQMIQEGVQQAANLPIVQAASSLAALKKRVTKQMKADRGIGERAAMDAVNAITNGARVSNDLEKVYVSQIFNNNATNIKLYDGTNMRNVVDFAPKGGFVNAATTNLANLQQAANLKNGLYVYPQWALGAVEKQNTKDARTKAWATMSRDQRVMKQIDNLSKEFIFPKLGKMVERSFNGPVMTKEQLARVETRKKNSQAIIGKQLSSVGVQEWVHPVVADIIAANDNLNEGGFGQISSKSLPLYAGRFIDEKGNIRTLPSPSEKYLNPTSKIQRETYLEAKILNNWNKLVHTVDEWTRLKTIPADKYEEKKLKAISSPLTEPEKLVPKYKTLQLDIAKYRAIKITNLSVGASDRIMETYKYLFWNEVYNPSGNAEAKKDMGLAAAELSDAISSYNALFLRKREGEYFGQSEEKIRKAVFAAGEEIKTAMENILFRMEPADATLISVEMYGKQIKYGLGLVDSALITDVNSIYNMYKAALIPTGPVSPQEMNQVKNRVDAFKASLREDVARGKYVTMDTLKKNVGKNVFDISKMEKSMIPRRSAPSLGFSQYASNFLTGS